MQTAFSKAILLLEDGLYFEGHAAGKIGTNSGEICFNTGMTGYQEIFTDPSYFGQILIATNVHIGNYGIEKGETESSSIKIAGLVCRNFSNNFSRKSADESIMDYFERENTVGISDVDTRALVRHIREKGAMNAIISSEVTDIATLKEMLAKVPKMAGLELSSKVSTKTAYEVGDPVAKHKIAVLDLGVKSNIIRSLNARDCFVKVFPAKTPYAEMKSWGAQGYLISNGPGDPSVMPYAVDTVKDILHANAPMMGICLGHQILAEASGISTYKMHHGHRGINHPVKNLRTGKCEITSQNHGFSVSEEEVKINKSVEITHLNLNDNTIEGIRILDRPAFSVQFHPEASAGPHDSSYLFEEFVQLVVSSKW
jgi:carbamoyl-phosphate synthase small subunit